MLPTLRSPRGAMLVLGVLSLTLPTFAVAHPSGKTQPESSPVGRLIRALDSSQGLARERAADTLGRMGLRATPAIPALVRALGDSDPFVAGKASVALGRLGEVSLPFLARALADTNPNVRYSAAIAVFRVGGRSTVPLLANVLQDPDDRVRWTAAVALGTVGPDAASAAPALAALLSDRDEEVRIAASRALEGVSPGASSAEKATAVIDSLVPALMTELHVPGVSVAVVRNARLSWSRCYGVADEITHSPVRSSTMFEACSMSKPVFASIVLKLVELGTIALDTPLAVYVPQERPELRPITARMVLTHTSGLPNWRKGDEEREGPLTVAFTPGSRFSYSGEGFYYLQRVVEQVTGQSLDRLADRLLFAPLGLQHCSYVWRDSLDAGIATGHDLRGKVLQKTAYVHANAAYSLYVSAEDYARLIIELLAPDRSASHSLSRRSVDTMLSHQVRVESRDPIVRPGAARGFGVSWGLGWSLNSTRAGDIVHHSGANRSGFRCFSQFSRSRGTGLVIMTNGTNGGELWSRVVGRIGDL